RWTHTRAVFDPSAMTDLPASLRERLREGGLSEPGAVGQVHASADGTRKLLLDLDRNAKVECVLIPMTPGNLDADAAAGVDDDEQDEHKPKKRVTLCISTQFGCAMGCVFCASGQSGLFRGLGAAEIVYQVLRSKSYLAPDE